MLRARALVILGLASLALAAGGCGFGSDAVVNQSFALSRDDARRALAQMQKAPKAPPRPVVVLGGYNDPGLGPAVMKSRLRSLCSDDARIIHVAFGFCWSFDGCRDRAIEAVDRAFPSDDPVWTTEVDVVTISMGGLVARYSAAPTPATSDAKHAGRRLKIARLFTIVCPHRGAKA